MPTIVFGAFGGENRKRSPFLLGLGTGVFARNLDFSTGKATPFRAPSFLRNLGADTKSIAFFQGNVIPIPFTAEKAIVGLPRGGRQAQLLITGEGVAPQVVAAGETARTRFGAPYTANMPIGVISGISAGNLRTNVFVVTVVMADGTEGVLSAPLSVMIGEDQSVNISVSFPPVPDESFLENEYRVRFPLPAPLPTRATAAKPYKVSLYRAIGSGLNWLEDVDWNAGNAINFSTVAYNQNAGSLTLAQFVGQETRPRLDLRGITVHPKGFVFGFSGNRLCFSAIGQFGLWPRAYEIVIPEGDILAAIEYDSGIFVFPENSPPVHVRLDSPISTDVRRMETSYILQPEHARAVVNMGRYGVWCPVREGIMRLPDGDLITAAVYSERGSAPFVPPTTAFAVADEFFGARNEDVLYLTLRGAQPGLLQAGTIAGFGQSAIIDTAVADNGTLCLSSTGTLSLWAAGESLLMEWKSGRIRYTDKNTQEVAWIFGGNAETYHRAHNNWASSNQPPAIVGDFAVWSTPDIVAAATGDITLSVITENGTEDVNFSTDGTDVFTTENCDCIEWLAETDVTGWIQLELRSQREVFAVGVYANYDAFLDEKSQIEIFPASGYVQ